MRRKTIRCPTYILFCYRSVKLERLIVVGSPQTSCVIWVSLVFFLSESLEAKTVFVIEIRRTYGRHVAIRRVRSAPKHTIPVRPYLPVGCERNHAPAVLRFASQSALTVQLLGVISECVRFVRSTRRIFPSASLVACLPRLQSGTARQTRRDRGRLPYVNAA